MILEDYMDLSKILSILDEIMAILKEYHVTDWYGKILRIRQRLSEAQNKGWNSSIQACLVDIRCLYGGMGSFQDRYISDIAGDNISPELIIPVNKHLAELLSELYRLVNIRS